MAEVLTYSQSLTSMTGGRGDYHMQFLRYEEVPAHIAQKLIEAAKKEQGGGPRVDAGYSYGLRRRTLPQGTCASRGSDVERPCAICERTLLMGERPCASRRTAASDYVDVCPLCQETAVENGWIKEGSPTTPTMPADGAGAARFSLAAARARGRAPAEAPVATSRSCAASPSTSSRSSRRPTSSTPPSTGARSAGSRRASASRASRSSALGRQPRHRRHGRLGDLLVPVPRHARLGPARAARRARPRPGRARGVVHGVERAPGGRRPDRPRYRAALSLVARRLVR